MAAAVSIAVLLAVSFLIVRVAAVAMRQTGLAENVARFQCVSALTGTGFTTSESEMIVNYPVRRRILVTLMILGNLGLVSIGATFIVSFVQADDQPGAIIYQAFMIAGAIGIIFLMMLNKTLDRTLCKFIGVFLLKFTSLGKRRFQRILQIGNGMSVAEHIHRGAQDMSTGDLRMSEFGMTLLAIHGISGQQSGQEGPNRPIVSGDSLVCFGRDEAHEAFEDFLTGQP